MLHRQLAFWLHRSQWFIICDAFFQSVFLRNSKHNRRQIAACYFSLLTIAAMESPGSPVPVATSSTTYVSFKFNCRIISSPVGRSIFITKSSHFFHPGAKVSHVCFSCSRICSSCCFILLCS